MLVDLLVQVSHLGAGRGGEGEGKGEDEGEGEGEEEVAKEVGMEEERLDCGCGG